MQNYLPLITQLQIHFDVFFSATRAASSCLACGHFSLFKLFDQLRRKQLNEMNSTTDRHVCGNNPVGTLMPILTAN